MAAPSSRRREGRNAFDYNTDPFDICPYKNLDSSYYEDWMEGWAQAQQEFNEQKKKEEQK